MALKRSRLRDAAKTSTLTGAGKKPTATSSDDRGSEISGESRCTRAGNKEQVSRQRSLKMRPGRGRPATELGRGGAAACAARGVPRQEPLPAKMPARCRKDRHGPRLPVRAGGSLRRGPREAPPDAADFTAAVGALPQPPGLRRPPPRQAAVTSRTPRQTRHQQKDDDALETRKTVGVFYQYSVFSLRYRRCLFGHNAHLTDYGAV